MNNPNLSFTYNGVQVFIHGIPRDMVFHKPDNGLPMVNECGNRYQLSTFGQPHTYWKNDITSQEINDPAFQNAVYTAATGTKDSIRSATCHN